MRNHSLASLQILFSLFVLALANGCLEDVLFSSKTPYKLIKNLDVKVSKPHPNCVPIQLNMVHRHGNRYPSFNDIRKMNAMEEKLNKAINSTKLKLPWKNPFTADEDKMLSTVGETELYELAKRIKARFPEIFKTKYSQLSYNFQSSCKLRCTQSSIAFSAGLFEGTGSLGKCGFQPVAMETLPCDSDTLLRFFDHCQKYITDVENNKSAGDQLRLFGKGAEMKSVLEKIKFKLGTPSLDLNAGDLKTMYVFCSYEIGMFNGSLDSGICSLFDQDDRRVMEYYLDLKHFYKRSAGYKITYESSCPLLKAISKTLESAANNNTKPYAGIFRSSHAETIIPLYALLGVFLDEEKMTAKTFNEMRKRKFRAACIAPFSGHLYFVLYRCDNNRYKIQLYVNERLVKIPCCDSDVDCDFDVFLKCYHDIVKQCNFKEMCKLQKSEL